MKITKPTFSGAKPTWATDTKNNELKIFKPVTIKNTFFGPITLEMEKDPNIAHGYLFQLKNSHKKPLGKESTAFFPKEKTVKGRLIEVEPEYRKKGNKPGHKFGELLRLGSIMALVENKMENIKIYSKNSAIYFHSKYKFEPDITGIEELIITLKTISEEKSQDFQKITAEAKLTLELLEKNNIPQNTKKVIIKRANKLIKNYINKAMEHGDYDKKHQFTRGFDMVLKHSTVIEKRKFFNNLYKKHGIDYEI